MSKDSFKPPQDVANAAKRGLEKREKQAPSDKCCTPTGLARARDLMNRAGVSKDTIKRMNSFFARHGAGTSKEGLDDPNSKASQAWDIWGGDPGKKWADGIKKDLERKGEYLSGSPESYADDAGRWITIGSWKGEVATKGGGWKEENTGGARVFVKNGVILKGPKNLSGRKLSDLDKDIPQDKREKIAKSQGEKNKAFIEAFKKKMEKEGTLADGAKKQPKKPAQEPEKTQNDKRLEALANRKGEQKGPKKDLMQEAMEHLAMMKKLDQEKKAKESAKGDKPKAKPISSGLLKNYQKTLDAKKVKGEVVDLGGGEMGIKADGKVESLGVGVANWGKNFVDVVSKLKDSQSGDRVDGAVEKFFKKRPISEIEMIIEDGELAFESGLDILDVKAQKEFAEKVKDRIKKNKEGLSQGASEIANSPVHKAFEEAKHLKSKGFDSLSTDQSDKLKDLEAKINRSKDAAKKASMDGKQIENGSMLPKMKGAVDRGVLASLPDGSIIKNADSAALSPKETAKGTGGFSHYEKIDGKWHRVNGESGDKTPVKDSDVTLGDPMLVSGGVDPKKASESEKEPKKGDGQLGLGFGEEPKSSGGGDNGSGTNKDFRLSLAREADALIKKHDDDVKAMGGKVPVGAAHMDNLIKGEITRKFAGELGKGKSIEEASKAARELGKEWIEKHNKVRSDKDWKRSPVMADGIVDALSSRASTRGLEAPKEAKADQPKNTPKASQGKESSGQQSVPVTAKNINKLHPDGSVFKDAKNGWNFTREGNRWVRRDSLGYVQKKYTKAEMASMIQSGKVSLDEDASKSGIESAKKWNDIKKKRKESHKESMSKPGASVSKGDTMSIAGKDVKVAATTKDGGLALHKNASGKGWTLTHAGSGLKVYDYPTKKLASNVLEAIDKEGGVDWTQSGKDLEKSAKKIIPILKNPTRYFRDGGTVQYKDEPKKDGWVTIRGRKVLIKNGEMVNPPEWMDGGKSKPSGDSGKEPEVKSELGKGKKVTTPEERELERARKEYDKNIETKRALKEAQKDLQAADAKKRRKGEAGANIRASKAKKSKIKRMMEAFKKDRKKANESTFMKELRNTFEQLKKSNFFRDATLKYGDGDAIFYEGRWITIGARKSKEERKAGEGGGESRGRRRRREGSDSPKNDGIPSGGARVFIKGGKKNAVIEKGPDGLEGKKIKDLDGGLSEKAKDEKAKKNLEKAKSKKNAYFGKKKGKKDGLSEKGKSDMDKLNAIELDFSPPKIKAALDDDDSPKAPKNIDAAVQGLMDALDSAGHLDKGIDKAKDKVKGMKGLDQKIKYGVLKKLDELAGKKKGDGKKSLNAHQKAVVDHALASKGHIYDKEALDNVEVMLENFGVPEDVINDTISEIKEASDKAKKDGKDYGKDFDRAAYVKKVEEWENSLTDDHKRHISDFTGIGYDSIRAYQRGDHLKMSASEFRMKYNYSVEYAKEAAESIENALSTGPKMEVMTYRGLNDLPSDVYDKIMGQKSMEFNAMASSSFTYSVAQEFRDDGSSLKDSLMFEIENKSGVSIKGLSDMPWEDEVLIPQGTKYEIISTEETTRPSGARVGKIRLREISK